MSTRLSCGIVGLPNVGKSTLFKALTKKSVEASNYPFCTIDPNVGVVDVPDPRLEVLSKLSGSKKIIHAAMTFVDIAGLVKGAAGGEGLGNKFLSNIRETDVIIQVVRCFEDEDVVHVEGKIDPIQDIEIINLELILADIQMTENICQKMEKQVKGNKDLLSTLEALKKTLAHLNENKPVRSLSLTTEEEKMISPYSFLTKKKVIYLTNVSEESLPDMTNEYVKQVQERAKEEGAEQLAICAKLEAELSELSPEEVDEYLTSLGLKEPGLNRLISKGFETLGLISYLTTGEQETRAWTVVKGDNAATAGGKIHTDIEKGFIRAEVVSFEDMIEYDGRVGAKEAGKARAEGRDYIVKDGDVILFFHN